jgi:predicted DNA-binding transcriptional regulator AlpA
VSDKLLLNIREVAGLLGVSPRAVWGWAADGKFPPPLQLGRLRRWHRGTIERFLDRQAEQTTAEGVER